VAMPTAEVTESRWKRLGDMLMEAGLLTKGQLEEGLAEKARQKCFLGQALVKLGYISQPELISFLVKQCKIPHINLVDYQVDPRIAALLPAELCREYKILPIDKLGNILTLAMVNPLDIEALEHARAVCPTLKLKPILCSPEHFEAVAHRLLVPDAGSPGAVEAEPLTLKSFGLSAARPPVPHRPTPSLPKSAELLPPPDRDDYTVLVREILGELLSVFQGPAAAGSGDAPGPFGSPYYSELQFSFTLDVSGVPCYVSDAVRTVLGYPPEAFKTQFLDLLSSHPANSVLRRAISLSRAGQQHAPIEAEFTGADGTAKMLHVALIPVFDNSHGLVAVQGVARDISRRERAEEQVFNAANHDPLTGLLNRRSFLARMADIVQLARRHGTPVSAGVINLDHFTDLNREFGHAEGDRVLVALGHMLRESLRGEDCIARSGGDEFCVLMPQVAPAEAQHGLARFRQALAGANFVADDGRPLEISVTAALVPLHQGNMAPEGLLEAARAQVLAAKIAGGDRVVTVDAGLL